MTVGQELAKITSLRLFHNHMTIEPVYELFGDKNKHWKTIGRLRQVFFEDFAESDLYGMIYTRALDFGDPKNYDSIAEIAAIFERYNSEICYAELYAPLEIRLQRNTSENRYKHKPSKKLDYDESVQSMLDTKARRYSIEGEIPWENFLRIDNSNIEPETTAAIIKKHFKFT